MFKPLSKPTLSKEQETKAMVAFLADLAAIQAAIKEFDAAKEYANAAEQAAYVAVKEADIKAEEVAKKEVVVDNLIKANIEALQKAQADINAAKAAQATVAAKEAAMARWEAEAVKVEATYADKMAKYGVMLANLDDREATVTQREAALKAQLDAFKNV